MLPQVSCTFFLTRWGGVDQSRLILVRVLSSEEKGKHVLMG